MYSIAIAKDKYEHVKCDQTYFKKEKREHYEKKKKNTAYKSERTKEFIIGNVYLLLTTFTIHKKGKNNSINFKYIMQFH